jgi:hypothetical protein
MGRHYHNTERSVESVRRTHEFEKLMFDIDSRPKNDGLVRPVSRLDDEMSEWALDSQHLPRRSSRYFLSV